MLKNVFFTAVFLLLNSTFALSQEKIDVWDFGAKQLDASVYNNNLTEAAINSWYSVPAGTGNTAMPTTFTAGDLSWTGGTNDRLRTSNTAITRYDQNVGPGATAGFTGRLYVNAGGSSTRFLTLTLNADDEVSIFTNSDAAGILSFINVANPTSQTDTFAVTNVTAEYKFVAKSAGNYKVYENVSKPSYYQIRRKKAQYVTVTGNVDTTHTTVIPPNYSVNFTNEAGKTWTAPVTDGTYSVTLPVNYNYNLSLGNANGYVITSGENFATTSTSTTHNIAINQVTLYQVSGSISGLSSSSNINNLNLIYTPDPESGTVYDPKPTINRTAGTYTVNLEANITYTISAAGVNDDEIIGNSILISAQNTVSNIVFSAKPKYAVSISSPGLNAAQLGQLQLSFTNVNESGYVYNFADINAISLRNGTYSVLASGLDSYPVELQLTSYLKINNSSQAKILTFIPVKNWSFEDKVITTATPNYKGLNFTGNIANEIAKGHIICQSGSSISIPVNPGEKLKISYYYAANFSIDGNPAIITTSGSTSLVENTEYTYTGTSAGNVLVSMAGLSYISEISKSTIIAYSPTISVGSGKDYPTINAALTAISNMSRTAEERVTVMIDPGNYEEMLVIKNPNITLKNAATSPSIDLSNQGVDISANAVRITSYYGFGYNYFSQGKDNKWNQTVLEVNKANGFTNYSNVSGTTNDSYWNATVVVLANNFEAEDIIFENSFNQYISAKEANDVLVEVVGNKGTRPKTTGNVSVQNRSFVERAAAFAVGNGIDKTFLKNCRIVGRQDAFFGGTNARVAVYKGVVMGAVDYVFGPMIATFYQTKFSMNVSDVSSDAAYLTAPQQVAGRGFLLYECTIGSAIPGVETASLYRAKPGFFGRPWAVNTGEAVIYKATVETSDYPGSVGVSLISPPGWTDSLSGTSDKIYEYQTTELSGVNNAANRVSWSKILTTPFLTDGTEIKPINFTKGNDGWDPFNLSTLGVTSTDSKTAVHVFASAKTVFISNVKANTEVKVYHMNGSLAKMFITKSDTKFDLPTGIFMITVQAEDGIKSVKVLSK